MQQRRYQIWSVDPLTDDAWPISGTFTLAAAHRILARYNSLDRCHRIVEVRPVDVLVPKHHQYWCRVRFVPSGREVVRGIMADDVYGVVREVLRRFGRSIDLVSVWLFESDMQAGDQPILRLDRDGKIWRGKRFAS